MRDFEWTDALWAVINEDGSFAGAPCLSYEEARELSAAHVGSKVFAMDLWDDAEPRPMVDDSWNPCLDKFEGGLTW